MDFVTNVGPNALRLMRGVLSSGCVWPAVTLLLLVGCGLGAEAQQEQGSACTVDEAGTRGVCRSVQDCPPLLQLVSQIRRGVDTDGRAVAELRALAAKCPFSGGRQQLCCQDEPTRRPEDTEIIRLPSEDVCGVAAFTGNVINGRDVGIGEHPWIVSIQYSGVTPEGLRHACGGSLITKRHVLTAAHCVAFLDNPDITPEEVRIGEVNFDTPTDCLASDPEICAAQPVNIKISSIIAHPEFQNIRPLAFPNDIAVLRLAEDVTFSDFRRPVCLPLDLARLRTGSDLTVGEEAIIVGWGGVDSDRMENFTPVLQGALVPVQSPEVCSGAFNISVAFENRICAGGGPNGSDTCSGDSGGPLLAAARSRFFQTGVSSFGAQFCGLSAAAYTRVADYIDWIQQAIATN